MVLIAMTLVMFSHDLYPWYAVAGQTGQTADQQIAGAILWVCGEVTFLPSILYTITRWLDDDDMRPAPIAIPVPLR
jgi:cytochrome c oxidase assembly factor CtaG